MEGRDLAVDASQAAALRPLWMAYAHLSQSDAASSVELEALVAQIEETLSDAQRDADGGAMLTPLIEALVQILTERT